MGDCKDEFMTKSNFSIQNYHLVLEYEISVFNVIFPVGDFVTFCPDLICSNICKVHIVKDAIIANIAMVANICFQKECL